ncbi:MaoC family dehydratase [Amycolatopsis sp. cg13]|uniref:MaoC family dehydratase n=1 Tax=Amycolatopsis sp. cg13 TaxID=3238807 RepID=UPI003525BD8F
MATHVSKPADLLELVGKPMGESGWYEITQHQVDQFGDATRDHQWIHVNPEQAKEGPFGGPIAHGYLTLSLAQQFLADTVHVDELAARLNYGLNKVRFTAPVPVGGRVRGVVALVDARQRSSGVEAAFEVTVELAGSQRPALVAETLVLYK